MEMSSNCLALTRAPSGVRRRQTVIASSLQSASISSRLLSFAGLERASVDVKEKSMRFSLEKNERSASSFDLLLQWIRGMGGRVGDMRVVQDGYSEDSGYGLYATEGIPAWTIIVSLPPACQLRLQESSFHASLLENPSPEDGPTFHLALAVLSHALQGQGSPFAPYIGSLSTPSLPEFFSETDRTALEFPPVIDKVESNLYSLRSFAQVLSDASFTRSDPFPGHRVDLKSLGWAVGAVASRSFNPGPGLPRVMTPLIDMANHSFTPNCGIDSDGDDIILMTVRDVEAGEQLSISYGEKASEHFLMDYGFVPSVNPFDRIAAPMDPLVLKDPSLHRLSNAELLERWPEVELAGPSDHQFEALGRLGITEFGCPQRGLVGGSLPVDPLTLAVARVLSAEDPEALANCSTSDLMCWERPALGPQNEVDALKILVGFVAALPYSSGWQRNSSLKIHFVGYNSGSTLGQASDDARVSW